MTSSEQINEIAAALSKAQGEIEGAIKGKENPHFRSKYADLGAVMEACRGPFAKHGLSIVQPLCRLSDGTNCTVTRILHASGQWLQDEGIPLLLSKQDMQGLGSALTYSRRYGLMSMAGIAPEDDDGNAASKTNGAAVVEKAKAPTGYDDWLIDLRAVADEGLDRLKAAWTASKPEYRRYLASVDPEGWEALKAKAAQRAMVPA